MAFEVAFYTQYWNSGSPSVDAKPPRYGVFHLDYLPDSWKPATCAADLNGDAVVDLPDVMCVVNAWGSAVGDVNGDGQTNVADLLAVLTAFGGC